MKNMTKHDALVYALNTVMEYKDNDDVREVLTTMIAQLSKPRKTSDEAKAKASAKRKENNAKERRALCAQVLPILREAAIEGGTAKEIFERCKDMLPMDFTANKVQYMLLHEMANEVDKIEAKNKPNVYKMKRV